MIVVDATVLANAVGDDADAGHAARGLLRESSDIAAPDLIDVECTSVFRRAWLSAEMTDERFRLAVADLASMPLTRYPALGFMERAYELRANVTAYDSCYVALVEALDCALYTGDRRLAHATGSLCEVKLFEAE